MTNILLVIHLLLSVAIIILVLLQQGKGSEIGAAFGGGSSQSLFGARGSANFLSRTTSIFITLFFVTSLTLAYLYNRAGQTESLVNETTATEIQPATEAPSNSGDDSDVPQTPE